MAKSWMQMTEEERQAMRDEARAVLDRLDREGPNFSKVPPSYRFGDTVVERDSNNNYSRTYEAPRHLCEECQSNGFDPCDDHKGRR